MPDYETLRFMLKRARVACDLDKEHTYITIVEAKTTFRFNTWGKMLSMEVANE